ncbi:sugar transporter ERD6-like 5 isoform X1 [Cornus florida]|uniref:sugar transporter ERD6-like 5 isoform X1 n=2 Tax=Cornus florida TaxID=4283 RepID=UPI00289CAD58|nr:sugar transporter ERD6-like 5 isoform X1 [Cornus florida]
MEEEVTRSLLVEEQAHANTNNRVDSSASSPFTAVVVFSNFVNACGLFAYGCASGYSSSAEAGIMEELGLSTAQYSIFGSVLTIGGMLGAIICGKVADLIGRRFTMWLLDIFFLVGWLAIYFAKGALLLDFGRLSLGFGIGLLCYVAPVYTAEITPKNIRGGCTAASQLMTCCGLSLVFFIGNLINWRTLALIGTIPCVLQVVGLFFIPESPRWLAKVGREKQLEASLRRLRGKNANISEEMTEIRDYTEMLQSLSESKFLDMFDWRYAHALTVGVGLMLLVQLAGTSGVSFYASSIFKATGSSVTVGTTAMAIIQIPASASSVFLMDTFGRRFLMMVAAAGACFGSFIAGLALLLQDLHQQEEEFTSTLLLIGILIYFGCFAMGMGNTPWVIMSEIFPINIKGSAGSLVTSVNWLSSWVVSYAFNFLFDWSSAGVFFIFGSMCALIVLFVYKMVPETKGRTLEEIQESMIHLK